MVDTFIPLLPLSGDDDTGCFSNSIKHARRPQTDPQISACLGLAPRGVIPRRTYGRLNTEDPAVFLLTSFILCWLFIALHLPLLLGLLSARLS